jgi:hypothetical protein
MLPYGVATARRAWLEAQDVINCWTKDKLLKWLKNRAVNAGGSPGPRRSARKSRV